MRNEDLFRRYFPPVDQGKLRLVEALEERRAQGTELVRYGDTFLYADEYRALQKILSRINKSPEDLYEEGRIKVENGRVRELNLRCRSLKELNPCVGVLKNLKKLYLHYDKLTSIPKTIGNLRNLREFALSYNDLTSLPPTIGNLTNLLYLDVSGNDLPRSLIEDLRKKLPNTR